MATDILTIPSNEGTRLNIAGGIYRILVSGAQTNGAYAIIEMIVPPGAGPVPHSHPDFEETFYVAEGEVQFRSEDGIFCASKNSFIRIPEGGKIHAFKNLSSEPATLLCTVVPAGLDNFFTDVATFMENMKHHPEKETIDIKAKLAEISKNYGQTLFAPNYFEQ